MKKIYIMVTGDIHPIGGMQLLVSGKAEVLEKLGWQVIMYFPSHKKENCMIDSLNKYNGGGLVELTLPPYKWPPRTRRRVIHKMCSLIGIINEGDKIIVESHSDRTSQWGEILAAEIGAKHMVFLCNEFYRGKDKYYLENLDFYNFKYKRGELAAECEEAFFKLFEGYKNVNLGEVSIFLFNENPVRDVKNQLISKIQRTDWNIGYIGRLEKGYVPNIIKAVALFAKKHKDKDIQFVIVGDISSRRQLLEEEFNGISNLHVNALGNMVPIPKTLFKKIDVVIAGSGSAWCAAYEGVYTILADSENYLSNGVLGYDTNNHLYHNQTEQTSFEDSLEKVLVIKEYNNKESILPPYNDPETCTQQNLNLIRSSSQIIEFYPEKKICAMKTNYIDAVIMRIYDLAYKYAPQVAKLLRIVKRKASGE